MNSIEASKELLDRVCKIDRALAGAVTDEPTREGVLNKLNDGFTKIVENYPQLVEDIIEKIVKYHANKDNEGKITDFITLVGWYSQSLESESKEGYWDKDGKYYNGRLSEVITHFLIARHNLNLF